MKRYFAILTLLFVLFSGVVYSSVYLTYQNYDNENYSFDVKIAGVMTKVTFGSSRISNVTIRGDSNQCIIYTPCGEIILSSNMKISIRDGCITIE